MTRPPNLLHLSHSVIPPAPPVPACRGACRGACPGTCRGRQARRSGGIGAEILENPLRGLRQRAVQGAAAGIFVTSAAKPLGDGGHVYSPLAAQAEADATVA